MCLPLLVFPCTIKSRSSLLAPGGPGKRAVKRLWCGVVVHSMLALYLRLHYAGAVFCIVQYFDTYCSCGTGKGELSPKVQSLKAFLKTAS